jgi:hypothetical protein
MTSSGVGECRLGALLVWCGIFTTLAGAAHSAKDGKFCSNAFSLFAVQIK